MLLPQVLYEHQLRLKWEHLFLFLATYCLFSCWRHVHRQYLAMASPRPEQVRQATAYLNLPPYHTSSFIPYYTILNNQNTLRLYFLRPGGGGR